MSSDPFKHRGGAKPKVNQKPTGSALLIFWRLFRQFAVKYWMRLVVATICIIIMGGAMHAFLSFLDFGVVSLEAGFSKDKTNDGTAKQGEDPQENVIEKLLKNRVIKGTLQFVHIDLDKNVKEIKQEKMASQEGNLPAKKEEGLFGKINQVSSRFGLVVSKDDAISFPLVCVLIGMMLFFFLVKTCGECLNKYLLRWIGAKLVTDIREALFNTFQHQSIAFFSKNDVGQIISRCTYDAGVIESSFSNCIAELFNSPVTMLVAVLFVLRKAISSNMVMPCVILLIAMPVIFAPVYWITKLIRNYQYVVLGRVSILVARMQEVFSGIRVVKIFDMENFERNRFAKDNRQYFRSVKRALIADIFMQPVMQFTAMLLVVIFVLLCFHYKISLGDLAVLGFAAQNAYKPIKELAKMNTNLQKCAAAAERIFITLDANEVIPEPEHPVHKTSFDKAIELKNVTFSYEQSERPVLENFSLEIKKGQLVALVGPTGSGKSTVANILPRFYDPNQGEVLIDGVNIKDIPNTDIRSLIGVVSQDTFLFNEDVAFNIGYGKIGAAQEEIEQAARLANAHDFIMEDSAGYQRPVGERGCLLSGGQRQRIAIARAILKNPPILILDEATSALDTVTEQQVQQAITELMKERTVLAIAHRLSTIVHADKIIVVNEGKIVEQGTHEELYAANGQYRRLYDLQAPLNK